MLKSEEIKSLFAKFENASAEMEGNAGENIQYHFADVSKMVEIGSGAEKAMGNFMKFGLRII